MIRNGPARESTSGPLPADVEGFDSLSKLALDLRSSWNDCTDDVWRQLDPLQSETSYEGSETQSTRNSLDTQFRS
jgi:hypothetical protein